jgi:hypothetical protein
MGFLSSLFGMGGGKGPIGGITDMSPLLNQRSAAGQAASMMPPPQSVAPVAPPTPRVRPVTAPMPRLKETAPPQPGSEPGPKTVAEGLKPRSREAPAPPSPTTPPAAAATGQTPSQ